MVAEIDRNPETYSDGNAAEVRLWSCGFEEEDLLTSTKWPRAQSQTPPMNIPLRKTGDVPARIRIILYLSTTNPPSINLTPTSVSPRPSFSVEPTPNSQPALPEGGIMNERDTHVMELCRQNQPSAGKS